MVKVGDFSNPQMQMIGRADFKDVIRFQEMQRRRRFFIALDVIAVLCLVFGILAYNGGMITISYWLLGIAAAIVLFFIIRYLSRNKSRNFRPERSFNRRRHRRRFRRQ